MSDARRRAARLVRWYPRSWRAIYGEEFLELLVDDLTERPRSVGRTLDIVRGGVVARLSSAGLSGLPSVRDRQISLSAAWIVASFAVFLSFGNALWSQLLTSWRWAQPRDVGTAGASWVLSGAMVALLLIALAAVAPLALRLGLELLTVRSRHLALSTTALLAGLVTLTVGALHFAHRWPGTNGHHVSAQGWIPARVGSFVWAATMSITSYWAHFHALGAFPASEIAWMIISPLALVLATAGAVGVVRRLHFSERLVRYESRLGRMTIVLMSLFVLGAAVWVVDGTDASHDLFHRGLIDVIDLVAMALALAIAWRAERRVSVPDQSSRSALLAHSPSP